MRAVPFGKYQLLERINVGGMAEVYRARLVGVGGFQKEVAIKRILPAVAADQDFIDMFIDEAKITGQLSHANIAQVFELGRTDGVYFIALEYLPGRDLRAVFERQRRRGDIVPVDLACHIVMRVAEALDHAHRKTDAQGRNLGIIHRDISPQNVLVSYEGEVKLIDFGIAKAANKVMKTQAGILKGKFGYMSPEQVRGEVLDARSDLFAVGIVLFELLTGDRLFTGQSDYSILEKVREAKVPSVSTLRADLPPEVEKIVMRALAKDRNARYQHASELVVDLQRYLLTAPRPFGTADLALYMQTTFAEEWEREKRLHAEFLADDEPTLQTDPGEGLPPFDLDSPPIPIDEALASLPSRVPSPQAPPTVVSALPANERVGPPIGLNDDRPTKSRTEPGEREAPVAVRITDMATRVGKVPPPVASRPPPARAPEARALDPLNMPTAITNNLPKVRAKPPPIGEGDDDERTVIAHGGLPRELRRDESRVGPAIGLPEERAERETHVESSKVYVPRKRTNWTIVPISALVTLAAGVVFLQLTAPEKLPWSKGQAQAFADLVVVTDPPDAVVVLDGAVVREGSGKPFVTDRARANRTVELVVRKDGFRESTTSLSLAPGESRELTVALRPEGLVLTVKTHPSDARAFVDGREIGTTPATIAPLKAGSYTVRVERDCFKPSEQTVKLDVIDRTLAIDLEPVPGACATDARGVATSKTPGRLRLTSRPVARVFIDGVDTGRTTPLLDYPIAPGKYTVRLESEKNSAEEFDIEVIPGRAFRKNVVIGGQR